MPYDALGKSVFDETQEKENAEAFMKQAALYGNMPIDYTGNINLANRPQVQMPDGSVATVRSMSFNDNGGERLIPTVSQDGRLLNPQQAIAEYQRTGQHLGLFDSPAAATAMAQRIHDQQAVGYGNPSGNIPTQPATEVVTQGTTRKPTTAEYQAYVIDYLAKKGYSYDSAMKLMRPSIEAYAAQEQAENRATADSLISSMQNMKIDSPEYRQAALQLYRLDPQMGQFMLKEGISPKEQYVRGQTVADRNTATQQKMNYARFNAGLQLDTFAQRQQILEAYKQRQLANTVQQLMDVYGIDKTTAVKMALGGRRAGADNMGGVSKDDLKTATDGLKALDEEFAEGRAVDPNFQLSPEKQQMYNTYSNIRQLAVQGLNAKYGTQQQPKQRVKINPNDYNSVGPFIQDMVKKNGGMSKDVARAVRKHLGFDPDDTSPNNFVNQILKTHYDFSG